MLFHAYLRRGAVYIPTVAQREGGAYTDIEPVAVVPVTNTNGLRMALLETIARKNITVPVPKGKWPPPVLLKYAGLKTWSAFARDANVWSIDEDNGTYQIAAHRMHPKGYWERDPNHRIEFTPGTAIDTMIDRMIAILQDAARQG
jgi:hypothetical protein